jgi:hypothetical protein
MRLLLEVARGHWISHSRPPEVGRGHSIGHSRSLEVVKVVSGRQRSLKVAGDHKSHARSLEMNLEVVSKIIGIN